MLVIVGHGPSVQRAKLGDWIDQQTVVRLKNAPLPDESFGTRTDYICSRKDHWVASKRAGVEYWMFQCGKDFPGVRFADFHEWTKWYRQFSAMKPSHGLCAAMCATEFLNPPEIGVIGFDSIMHPDQKEQAKYDRGPGAWFHDQQAEAKAIRALGPRIINLAD